MNSELKSLLTDLIEKDGDYFYRYAYKLLGDKDQAGEAVHDMVQAAFENPEKFQNRSSLRTYLTSILRFKCVDKLRQLVSERKREVKDDLTDLFSENGHWRAELIPGFSSQEWGLHLKNISRYLIECLKGLTAEQKLLITLVDLEEKSRKEICNETGFSETNIGVMVFRARNNLRKCISNKSRGEMDSLS